MRARFKNTVHTYIRMSNCGSAFYVIVLRMIVSWLCHGFREGAETLGTDVL